MEKNDLLICAPKRDNPANSVFDIYARVVDAEDGIITLDRYQKYGALRYGEARYNMATIEEYYRPMTEEEQLKFAQTMCERPINEYNEIHLGGDRKYSGWEKITGVVEETLAVLTDILEREKEIGEER